MNRLYIFLFIVCITWPALADDEPKGLLGELGRRLGKVAESSAVKGQETTLQSILTDISSNKVSGTSKWINKRVKLTGYVSGVEKNLFGDYVDVLFTEADPANTIRSAMAHIAVLTFKGPGNLSQLTKGMRVEAYGDLKSIEGSTFFLENPALRILAAKVKSPEISSKAAEDYMGKLKVPIEQKQVSNKPSLRDRKEFGELILKSAQAGDISTLKEAVLAGGIVNIIEDGSTVNALFRIIEGKVPHPTKVETVEFLLQYGANPNAAFVYNSCLHVAVREGMEDIALFLLRAGADVNPKPTPMMESPLQIARDSNNVMMISLLMAAGAK